MSHSRHAAPEQMRQERGCSAAGPSRTLCPAEGLGTDFLPFAPSTPMKPRGFRGASSPGPQLPVPHPTADPLLLSIPLHGTACRVLGLSKERKKKTTPSYAHHRCEAGGDLQAPCRTPSAEQPERGALRARSPHPRSGAPKPLAPRCPAAAPDPPAPARGSAERRRAANLGAGGGCARLGSARRGTAQRGGGGRRGGAGAAPLLPPGSAPLRRGPGLNPGAGSSASRRRTLRPPASPLLLFPSRLPQPRRPR